MASLQNLPAELVLLICSFFDDFDDTLRLGQTCSHLCAILSIAKNRNQLFKPFIKEIDTKVFWDTNLWDPSIGDAVTLLANEISSLSEDEAFLGIVYRWDTVKILKDYGLGLIPDLECSWVVQALAGGIGYGGTPLTWAVWRNHEPIVKLLLSKGTDVNLHDEKGETPLLRAATDGNERMISLLLEKGARIELTEPEYGQTPLAWASIMGHEKAVKLLLDKGANIESKDAHGLTPLAAAAMSGHGAVVEVLLQHGADVEALNNHGQTVLSLSAERMQENTFSILFDWCINTGQQHLFNTADHDGATLLHFLCRTPWKISSIKRLIAEGADMCALDNSRRSPLLWAVERGPFDSELALDMMLERAEVLSQRPEVVLTPTTQGFLPLHFAACLSDSRTILYLLRNGGRSGLNHADHEGRTPFMVAMCPRTLSRSDRDTVERLLEFPDLQLGRHKCRGLTELHMAVTHCPAEILPAILRHNRALLNSVSDEGRTPLLHAIDFSEYAWVKALLSEGADPDIPDSLLERNSDIILHHAVLGSSVDKVRQLLASPNIDLYARNQHQQTALHVAVHNPRVELARGMVRLLLESDKSCRLASEAGLLDRMALDCAIRAEREECIEVLVQPEWKASALGDWTTKDKRINQWSDCAWYPDLLSILGRRVDGS
ncbi:ankyrin repeat-containing domain protein [Aspergillus transmontanensis]|uniref:Ankyrin repeat-containing domain protein n=1 Tax=Aspergillus transmontanensis TaxID=1034304 RepID=A0A5N6W5D9_9EURO|nr:ankyrin repeat-containing domain protein [Aspergillus transmontanensis]